VEQLGHSAHLAGVNLDYWIDRDVDNSLTRTVAPERARTTDAVTDRWDSGLRGSERRWSGAGRLQQLPQETSAKTCVRETIGSCVQSVVSLVCAVQ